MFIDVPAFATTAPTNTVAPAGKLAVIVCKAPSRVNPSGTVSGAVVAQSAVSVNVVPTVVPAQATVTGGFPPAHALPARGGNPAAAPRASAASPFGTSGTTGPPSPTGRGEQKRGSPPGRG